MIKETISVKVESSIKDFLYKLANETGRSVSFYISEAIEEYIEVIKRDKRYDSHKVSE